jgi:hypothetical protein
MKTAVELLSQELDEFLFLFDDDWQQLNRIIEEAKEMEKQQSIEFIRKYHDSLFHLPLKDGEAEQIYNHLNQLEEQ